MSFLKLLFFLLLTINAYSNTINLNKKEKAWIKNNKITVGVEEAKPYIFYDQYNNSIDGLYGEIFKLVIKKSGLKTTYIKDDWSKLLNNFKNKKLDLLPATFYSKERENIGLYSDPYYQVREYIYINDKQTNINKLEDLQNRTVAIVKGYATIKKLKNKYPKINIRETNSLTESITMLLNKNVDAIIDYHLVVETYIRNNSIVGLKSIAQSELDAISIHYLSHIDKPTLHTILQKSIKAISREEMNVLLKKWVTNPYEKTYLSKKQQNFLKNNTFNIYANNWEPFTIYNEKTNSFDGLSIDIWKKISEQSNIKYNLTNEKFFTNMLDKIKNDPNGLIISTSKTKDRENYATFTKSYSSFPIGVATNLEKKYILDFNELEGKKVAVAKNTTAHKIIEKEFPRIKFITTKNTDEALKLLSQNKVYATIEILPVLIDKMAKHQYRNIKVSGDSKIEFELQIMVNKQSNELVEILNILIDDLKASGEIERLNKDWTIKTRYVESINYDIFYKTLIPIVFILLFLLILSIYQKKSNKIILKQKKELETQKKEFEKLFDYSPVPMAFVENDNTISKRNSRFINDFGYIKEDINNLNQLYELLFPDESYRKSVKSKFDDAISINDKTMNSIDVNLTDKKGDTRNVLISGIVLNNGILFSFIDLTRQKQQEKIIHEQTKLASMGEMIGNIAHQWRQPLSIISSSATGIIMQKQLNTLDTEDIEKTCNFINDNAQYLSKTIDDFKNFIQNDRKIKRFNINNNINSFLNLVEPSLKKHNIELIKKIPNEIEINAYPNELIQCYMNIFNNTKDALNDSINEHKYLFIETFIENDNIIIKFKDNAGGINEDILQRIFEPYFTTKHKSQGTGLGLSMTYNLITKGMRGNITAKNINFTHNEKDYKGALFTITLPLSI